MWMNGNHEESRKVEVGISESEVGIRNRNDLTFRLPHSAFPLSCARGFTLIEVLISMVIMAIGLLAVFNLQGQNLDSQSEASFMTMAGQLARERVARIVAGSDLEIGHSSGDFQEKQLGFLYDEDVSRVAGTRNLFRIRVTITEQGDRTGRRYSLETLQCRQAP